MKRRQSLRSTLKTVLIILGVITAFVLIANLVTFLSSRDRLPHTTYLGGVDVSGQNIDEAISRTVRALQQPVALRYQGAVVPLAPGEVDFQLNDVVARLQLEKQLNSQRGLNKFPDYVLRRSTEVRIPAPYQYSEAKLDEFLGRVAQEHDKPPQVAQPDVNTLSPGAGQDGWSLNRDDARKMIIEALASGTSRFVDLPVVVAPGSGASIQSLGELVKSRLAGFVNAGNVAGVFIKSLSGGQEFSLNGDLAFSAPGWLKAAIAVEAFRAAGGAIDPQLATQLTSAVTDGSSANANAALKVIGQGDGQAGANQLNATLKRMGLVSTFLAQPYDQPSTPPRIITPGNARTDINTAPDPNAQSTPTDVSLLFEMLEQCRNNTGALPLAFPNEFTAANCEQALSLLGQNGANVLIAAGSPNSAVIHRQSWDANNHGDAALVRSPGGTYVVAVMLHGSAALNWGETSLIVSDIARATYGFFNQDQVPPPATAMNAPPPP